VARSRRKKSTRGGDDAARLGVVAFLVLVLTSTAGALRSWLAMWWPLVAVVGAQRLAELR